MDRQFVGQRSESFFVGAFLALVGGFLDVYTFICRDGVFANAQTGNMARLGICFAEGDWGQVWVFLIPILAFASGVFFAQVVRKKFLVGKFLHWRQYILLIEIVILAGTAFVPIGRFNVYVNIAISFVCALQGESFRKIQGKMLATTMCTGNLRSGMELLFQSFEGKDKLLARKSLGYFSIIFFFIIGATIGAKFTNSIGERATLVASCLLLPPLLIMFKSNNT